MLRAKNQTNQWMILTYSIATERWLFGPLGGATTESKESIRVHKSVGYCICKNLRTIYRQQN